MSDVISNGSDPSPRRASPPGGPSPGDAQPGGDASRHREEGKEGSRGTLGPDGSPVQENQSAQKSASPCPPDGYITNRPPNRPPEKTNAGGEDWFEVSLYLSYRNFHGLSAVLDAARKAAENGEEGDDTVFFDGVSYLVRPSGASAGNDKKRVYCRWQLQSENGLVIQLMNRAQPHLTMPNGNVRATSLLLMRLGAERVWGLAQESLRSIGCILERNKLSRVDPCVDMPEMRIQSLCEPYSAGNYVTRARASTYFEYEDHVVETNSEVHSFGRRQTGFVVGQGSLKLRVYDKCREANKVVEKITAAVDHRWGYWTPWASRVEFRIRRETLKDFGVDTVADWFAKRAEICEYLCTKWFRLTSGPVDRDHADRAETLPEWQLIQQAFAAWTGKPNYVGFQPVAKEEFLPSQLIQQAIGLLVSYFARTGTRIESNQHFIETTSSILKKLTRPRNLVSEIERRTLELGMVRTPFKEFESE